MENQTLETRRPEDFQAEFARLPVEARTVLDEQDYQRRVYYVAPNISVTFRGRDELPTIGSSEFSDGRPSVVLTPDELPHVVDQAEFSEYVASHSDTDSENKNLIVNATPVGIIDLAHILSGEATMNSERANIRANFLSGKVGDKENAILDMMATAFLDIKGGDPLAVSDGYMDVALALDGNAEKRATIHEKAIILSTQERGLVAKELGEDALVLTYEHEPIDQEVIEKAKKLVLVRATNNEPKINRNGVVEMSPAADHTREFRGKDGKAFVPRQTTHFTLNHYVQSHDFGDFRDRGFVVVAPLSKVLESGQRPTNLYGVDTYFTTGPGESVELPDAIVIKAGDNQEDLVVQEDNRRTYKTRNFKIEDANRLFVECKDGTIKEGNAYELKSLLIESAKEAGLVSYDGLSSGFDNNGKTEKLRIIPESTLDNLNFEQVIHELFATSQDKLDQVMAKLVKDVVVRSAIVEQGGSLVRSASGSNYVENTEFNETVGEIAVALNIGSSLHVETHDGFFESLAEKVLKSNEMIKNGGRYNWEDSQAWAGQQLNSYLSDKESTHRLRRATISDGIVAVRNEFDKEMRDHESRRVPGIFV